MTIDIVDYSDEFYEALTSQQYYRIQYAQNRKNVLLEELEEKIQKARQKLIKNGIFASALFEKRREKLQARYEAKVEMVKNELISYLGNTMRPSHMQDYQAPYVINFALSQFQRYELVKKYYLTAYSSVDERITAYKQDEFLMIYIQEYYEYLYQIISGAV